MVRRCGTTRRLPLQEVALSQRPRPLVPYCQTKEQTRKKGGLDMFHPPSPCREEYPGGVYQVGRSLAFDSSIERAKVTGLALLRNRSSVFYSRPRHQRRKRGLHVILQSTQHSSAGPSKLEQEQDFPCQQPKRLYKVSPGDAPELP